VLCGIEERLPLWRQFGVKMTGCTRRTSEAQEKLIEMTAKREGLSARTLVFKENAREHRSWASDFNKRACEKWKVDTLSGSFRHRKPEAGGEVF